MQAFLAAQSAGSAPSTSSSHTMAAHIFVRTKTDPAKGKNYDVSPASPTESLGSAIERCIPDLAEGWQIYFENSSVHSSAACADYVGKKLTVVDGIARNGAHLTCHVSGVRPKSNKKRASLQPVKLEAKHDDVGGVAAAQQAYEGHPAAMSAQAAASGQVPRAVLLSFHALSGCT